MGTTADGVFGFLKKKYSTPSPYLLEEFRVALDAALPDKWKPNTSVSVAQLNHMAATQVTWTHHGFGQDYSVTYQVTYEMMASTSMAQMVKYLVGNGVYLLEKHGAGKPPPWSDITWSSVTAGSVEVSEGYSLEANPYARADQTPPWQESIDLCLGPNLAKAWPRTKKYLCMYCHQGFCFSDSVPNLIIHLNDAHRFTFARIADYLREFVPAEDLKLPDWTPPRYWFDGSEFNSAPVSPSLVDGFEDAPTDTIRLIVQRCRAAGYRTLGQVRGRCRQGRSDILQRLKFKIDYVNTWDQYSAPKVKFPETDPPLPT